MEDIKKTRQFMLCQTVLRYSFVRKINATEAGWGFNFQNQTKEEYLRWLQILKSQIPNCEKFAKLELLAEVLSWAELDGYERFDLGMVVKATIDEAEKKLKEKKDDDCSSLQELHPRYGSFRCYKERSGGRRLYYLKYGCCSEGVGESIVLGGF